MTKLEIIQNSIEDKKTLEIRYFGGSIPGETRNILPKKIDGEKLWAICFLSGMEKTFILPKIELLYEGTVYSADSAVLEAYSLSFIESIDELYNKYYDEFVSLGWQCSNTGDKIELRFSGDRKAKIKSSYVILIYEDITREVKYNFVTDRMEEVEKDRVLKWSVKSRNDKFRCCSTLDKAAIIFLEYARKYSPAKI
ncbi:MAG: hypothetical protein ACM3SM_16025 [Bacteroidota bacterium]